MILPDYAIEWLCQDEVSGLPREDTVITPYDPDQLQPASYDVQLGQTFRVFDKDHGLAHIDFSQDLEAQTTLVRLDLDEPFYLHPGEFVLGVTAERFDVPDDLVMRIEGKSSIARVGVPIHATGGFVDPGFEGTLTLEITNWRGATVVLRPGMRIAQVAFTQMLGKAHKPYGQRGNHYKGQTDATAARFDKPLHAKGGMVKGAARLLVGTPLNPLLDALKKGEPVAFGMPVLDKDASHGDLYSVPRGAADFGATMPDALRPSPSGWCEYSWTCSTCGLSKSEASHHRRTYSPRVCPDHGVMELTVRHLDYTDK